MDSSRAHGASCSSSKRWLYDVFVSFRGEDTRKGFTSHLEVALGEAGISAFIDKDLTRGENMTDELNHKIESSRIAVIVFSKGYADSRWCLDELANIMDCRRREGQIVLPVFYDVDPPDVRHQTGSFEEGFKKHEKRIHETEDEDEKKLEEDKVKRWKKALKEAANVVGDHLTSTANGDEGDFIKKIVNEISGKLDNNRYLSVAEYPVGIDSRVQTISNYLDVGGSNDVRIIGIWGMGGMGKTTIAKAIWNKFHHRFQSKSFLSEVRTGKLVKLQNKLLSDILNWTSIKVHSVHEGITEIEKRIGGIKKVLVIIDDIDHADQLTALAIKHDSYGPGSRIIVTTRDEHLLNMIKVNEKYAAQAMNEEEALELFSRHAFRNHCAINDEYAKLAREIVDKCGGLPLALQVVGRSLFTRSTREWESALETLKYIPPKDVHEQLKISYDGLTEPAKSMFLDISCFFVEWEVDYAMAILEGCSHFSLESEFIILQDRCLVDVDIEGYLVMHDLLRDMGREIVCAESRDYPEKRSRLWRNEDVTDVLRNESGTKKIRGVMLDLSESHMPSFSTEGLRKMQRLKFLILQGVEFTGVYDHLSKELRLLNWHGFPLEALPEDLNLENLVAVDLSYSRIQVWKDSNVCLEKLKFLDLAVSKNLTRTPDISKLPNLQVLVLRGCTSLSEVQLPHSSVQLKSINRLDLSMCDLADGVIPEDLGSLPSLEVLFLCGNGFSRLPILSGLSKLLELKLNSCINLQSIPELPSSLKCLEANYCTALERMPDFSKMSNMRELHLKGCHKLNDIQGLVDSRCLYLEWVHMEGCSSFTASFKHSIIDGWFGTGRGGLFLSGNDIDIPGWFPVVIFNYGDFLFEFEVPESRGCNPKALTVCIIYSSDDSQSVGYLRLDLANHTQRTQFAIYPMDTIARTSHEDSLWMGNILNNNPNLKCGDKVAVSLKFFGEAPEDDNRFNVKKIGFCLKYDYVNEDPEEKIDCEPQPYSWSDSETDDAAGPSHHSSDEGQSFFFCGLEFEFNIEATADEETPGN